MCTRSFFVVILICIFLNPSIIFAQQASPSSQLKSQNQLQDIYPGQPYYQFKRLFEKISETFLFFPDSKINNSKKLVKVRFSEMVYIIEKNDLNEIQKASERFAYQAGKLTELTEKQPKETKEKTIKLFKNYKEDFEQLKFKFEKDSSYWILILHDINTLTQLTARLEKN